MTVLYNGQEVTLPAWAAMWTVEEQQEAARQLVEEAESSAQAAEVAKGQYRTKMAKEWAAQGCTTMEIIDMFYWLDRGYNAVSAYDFVMNR